MVELFATHTKEQLFLIDRCVSIELSHVFPELAMQADIPDVPLYVRVKKLTSDTHIPVEPY